MKKYFRFFIFLILSMVGRSMPGSAQTNYSIDASAVSTEVKTGALKMGSPASQGPAGKEILLNNRYMTLGGKPILPVMGEIHFARVPRSQWEDVILKMKACGINIIACYAFWIHHEEIEGQFDWSGNRDMRAFVELCAKHNLWVYPRIGPWCHGEARNGGTPDWILQKKYLKDRSNDPVYQHYAARWFEQVAGQLKGLLYKEGGPVIGIQLENEYARGREGEPHIHWLKETALRCGIDVPMYTVTGWGDGSVPSHEVIPVWGAYADQPWVNSLTKNTNCSDFRFAPYRNDDKIGDNLAKAQPGYIDYSDYPYFTAEMGVGIENTNHSRLRIDARDGLALIVSKVGSGTNLVGYYMFAGGSNPHGLLTSMEEEGANPIVSYDFQAAIRESGALNDCYNEIKSLHYFLNEFGGQLAPMAPVFSGDEGGFQYTVRVKDDAAFLFGMNYCRHNVFGEKKNVQFNVKLKNETLKFPSKPVNISNSDLFIWPINFRMRDALLKYATAQPLCHIGDRWIFAQDLNGSPEFCFDAANISSIDAANGNVARKEDRFIVSDLRSGMDCILTIHEKNGSSQKIIVLSKEEAKHAWLFNEAGKKRFFVSDANLYMDGNRLHVSGPSASGSINALTEPATAMTSNNGKLFKSRSFSMPQKAIAVNYRELGPLEGAQWLKVDAGGGADGNAHPPDTADKLAHQTFLKEFSLGNPSKIRKAVLLIATRSEPIATRSTPTTTGSTPATTDSAYKLQVNNREVGPQNPDRRGPSPATTAYSLQAIDITDYVQRGENSLLLDFPAGTAPNSFAARLMVEYANADWVEILTDGSWLVKGGDGNYKAPDTTASQLPRFSPPAGAAEIPGTGLKGLRSYAIGLPAGYLTGLNDLYMKIRYTGNKARLYLGSRLIADDFYNGTTWSIGLKRYGDELKSQALRLEIEPLQPDEKIYFDDEEAPQAALHASVRDIRLAPDYATDMTPGAK